jgi:pyruvate,orthophosphate dikinase
MSAFTWSFDDAPDADQMQLGGKGAGLVRMVQLGLPVPPGFILGTSAGRAYLTEGALPAGLVEEVEARLRTLEQTAGRGFGDDQAPLLISVRSGAPVSMPGMMDTILNVGLTATGAQALARETGDRRFAESSLERLLHGFATTVRGLSAGLVEETLLDLPAGAGAADRCAALQACIEKQSARPFPDARGQLVESIEAVFRSWRSPRAQTYRRHKGIDEEMGTAVVVQLMVFGNRGADSASGVCFTRDPATGAAGAYGDILFDAQGEDVVAGERDTLALATLGERLPDAAQALAEVCRTLERDSRDLCDIEFTIEQGRLWVLQTRVGQRSGRAAVRIAVALAEEGLIDRVEAVGRVSEEQLQAALAPVAGEPPDEEAILGRGLACSPGAAVGTVALDCEQAQRRADRGEAVVLVRPTTAPADLPGVLAARAIVTARGGRASHAAVVARGLDRPAVCGTGALAVQDGDTVTVDGDRGLVLRGAVPLAPAHEDPTIGTFLEWRDAHGR